MFNSVFLVSGEKLTDNKIESLYLRLKMKHAGNPVILFIDENDIVKAKSLSSNHFLKNINEFHLISAFSPIVDRFVRLKSTGFDLNGQDIVMEDEGCLWVNLFLRYRSSDAIQSFCRNIGESLR